MEEEIIGNINGVNLPKITWTIYNLILTDKRIIGDIVSGTRGAYIAFGAVGTVVSASKAKKRAQEMTINGTPEQILGRHKRNFSIEYTNIKSIKFKRGTIKAVILKLKKRLPIAGKKVMFHFSKHQYDEAESLFTKVIQNYPIVVK